MSIAWCVDEHLWLYEGVLFSHKKELITDTFNNIGEPQNHSLSERS